MPSAAGQKVPALIDGVGEDKVKSECFSCSFEVHWYILTPHLLNGFLFLTLSLRSIVYVYHLSSPHCLLSSLICIELRLNPQTGPPPSIASRTTTEPSPENLFNVDASRDVQSPDWKEGSVNYRLPKMAEHDHQEHKVKGFLFSWFCFLFHPFYRESTMIYIKLVL